MQLISYLFNIFGFMFIAFRAYVVRRITTNKYTMFKSVYPPADIILMFLGVISLIFILKRNIVWASVYLGTYFAYFGYSLTLALASGDRINAIVYVIGLFIASFNFVDVLLNKNRKSSKNKKTDWFYKNEKYTRDIDSRADRNQYKIR